MIIRDFEPKHTEEAAEIALGAYNYERAFTQELPVISDYAESFSDIISQDCYF